jgi:hypothetical protein
LTGQDDIRFETVSLSSVSFADPVPVVIEVISNEGEKASLPYIELRVVRSGTKQITLDNSQQRYPIHAEISYRFEDNKGTLTFRQKDSPISVSVLADFVNFMNLFGRAGSITKVTLFETGMRLMESRRGTNVEAKIDPEWKSVLDDLVHIQSHTRTPIVLPNDDFVDTDRRAISQLRRILREGEWEINWSSDLTMTFAARDIPAVIERFDRRRSKAVWLERDESIMLFGAAIPLGTVRYFVYEATIENREQVLSIANASEDGDNDVSLKLVSGTNSGALITYLDWKENPEYLEGLSLIAFAGDSDPDDKRPRVGIDDRDDQMGLAK